MTELDTMRQIKAAFGKADLNEADTRFKIIDQILKDVLMWPLEPVSCEKYVNGNRADYVLYGKNSKPLLIVESKRNSEYFELPENANSQTNHQKITVEKLLTTESIKEAMLQVKEYCEDLGCNYGAICNGHVWIIFNINPQSVSWKKIPAFVIKNLDFFIDDYTHAINVLGYTSLVYNSSLKRHVGLVRQSGSEVFYPKTFITAYDTPVNSNAYASIFNAISRKYLGNISFSDKEFIERCYVTNKGHFDDLQKNMHGVIFDSLTPFFRSEGVQDFRDDRKGGAFAYKIQDIIKKENLDNVMILFGGRGAGKSTFIKRLLFHLKPKDIDKYSTIGIVDLIDSSQIVEELTKEIWLKTLKSIDQNKLLETDKDGLLVLFDDKFKIFERQVLKGLEPNSLDYHRLLNDFLIQNRADTKYCCERVSHYWKSKGRGLIVVLDNMDQLRADLQDVAFLNAVEIAKKLSCLVIISMREERYFNAKSKGVLDAYHVPGFHLVSPVIPEVIARRLEFILDTLKFTSDRDLDIEFGIKNLSQLSTVQAFLQICHKEVLRERSELSKFLRYTTHGDVRAALDYFKGFLTSGYTNILEVTPHYDWKFQTHQVIKPMMIPSRFFYDERASKLPNVFQLRNDTNSSHFCGLRILTALNHKSLDKTSSGFIDIKFLLQKFETDYDLKDDCEKHLDIFLQKGIVEANNRLEEFSENVDQIRITAFGKYVIEFLAYEFTYVDLISLDCGLFDEKLNSQFVRAAQKELEFYYERDFMSRIESRLERVEAFINYLIAQEEKEFNDLALQPSEIRYSKKLKDHFDVQKQWISQSAKNRT